MSQVIYIVWILFWITMALKCVSEDYKDDRAAGTVPKNFSGIFWEYLAPFFFVVVVIGFGVVWAVAKFLAWVA